VKGSGKYILDLENFNYLSNLKLYKNQHANCMIKEAILKKLGIMFGFIFLFATISTSFAQLKIGYVDSQRILGKYQEAIDAQNKLEEIRNQYQAEYENKLREYQDMASEIESQSLLLSEEKKKEKLQQLQAKATEIDKYKFDKLNPEGGEFYKKNQELFKPVIDKINTVIQKIGTVEEYDLILDASSGVLLHALPKYDITTQVLDELNRGVQASQKK
jgi:outer membrane protein